MQQKSSQLIKKLGLEIHEYEPTPDIVKAQSADLILWNGLNLERWFERFFPKHAGNKPAVVVTTGIENCFRFMKAHTRRTKPAYGMINAI